jgi:hypothetical protein
MKLKWSGVAVLAVFASASHAQSSVTLYGAIDSGVFYQSTAASSFAPTARNNGHVYGIKDGSLYGSFWGIKGAEDIGGGYKVNFRLQGVFNSSNGKLGLADTTGGTAVFNQQATVGLSGPFGTFDAGRQYTPMIYAMADTDVRAAQYFGSILGAWLGLNQAAGWPGTNTNVPSARCTTATRSSTRRRSSTARRPRSSTRRAAWRARFRAARANRRCSGIRTTASICPPSTTTPTTRTSRRPRRPGTTITASTISARSTRSAAYRCRRRTGSARILETNLADYEMISGGLGYQFTPLFQITSGFYYLKDRNNSANHSSEYAVGAEYNLSKRTIVSAQIGYVANHGTMNQTIMYGQIAAPGVSTTAAMIGLRHSF